MANLNKVMLMGNLTRDPELRCLPSGLSVCEIGIATNRRFKGQDGEWKEEPTFVDVTIWGRRGEVVAQYLRKGSPIFVEGRLKFDTWEASDGSKRSKLRVVAENFEFIGGKGKQAQGDNGDSAQYGGRPAAAPMPAMSGQTSGQATGQGGPVRTYSPPVAASTQMGQGQSNAMGEPMSGGPGGSAGGDLGLPNDDIPF